VKINDIKTFVKGCVANNVTVPTLLVGTMGCGKSQIMAQVAEELGYKLIDLRLAQQEAGDLIGLPYQLNGRTEWAKPGWWPNEGEKCIIFLDELNRAPTDVRQAVFQLVLDRKIHTHTLPKTCFVHAAINPGGDMGNENYQVETLDPAMLRRFCVLAVDPDVDTWLAWAKGQGKIDNTVSEFVNPNRALLFKAEEIKLNVQPTPDSYRMLDQLLKAKVVMKEHQMEIFKGLIGKEAGVAFIKWLDTNYIKPVSGTQILGEYDKWIAKVKKQQTAENYATTMDLVALLTDKKTLTDSEFKNLVQFTLDIPKESQTALIAKMPVHSRMLLFKDQRVSKLLMSIVEQ
jgi:hypothetical protein